MAATSSSGFSTESVMPCRCAMPSLLVAPSGVEIGRRKFGEGCLGRALFQRLQHELTPHVR